MFWSSGIQSGFRMQKYSKQARKGGRDGSRRKRVLGFCWFRVILGFYWSNGKMEIAIMGLYRV